MPLRGWRHITELRNCVLLLDEISAVLPSRSFAAMPPELLRVINQLRKVDVQLGWSAPAWERCDLALREVVFAVTLCRGMLPDRWRRVDAGRSMFPARERDEDGRPVSWGRGWPPNRLFRFFTYDAFEFDEFTADQNKQARSGIRPRRSTWYWRSRHDAHRCYDTLAGVDLLDHLDFTGVCVHCDGSKKRHPCRCKGAGDGGVAAKPGATLPVPTLAVAASVVRAG